MCPSVVPVIHLLSPSFERRRAVTLSAQFTAESQHLGQRLPQSECSVAVWGRKERRKGGRNESVCGPPSQSSDLTLAKNLSKDVGLAIIGGTQ